ncbi:MAG: PDZ domain-containing protein [Phycisphaerae bacterium]|nr:PDZ domain-containing protein [Phycisphaerae bacterium]
MFSWLTYILISSVLAGSAVAPAGEWEKSCEAKGATVIAEPSTVCVQVPSCETVRAEKIVVTAPDACTAPAGKATSCRGACTVRSVDVANQPMVVWQANDGTTLRAKTIRVDAEAPKRGAAWVYGGSVVPVAEVVPAYWIGIRCTPVPEALAAHIGDDGVMIVNVAEDSPADNAGLDRYDVIRGFNGQAINELEELIDAIGGNEGADATVDFVRNGKTLTAHLTPVKREPGQPAVMKYDEPDAPRLQDTYDFRGLKLNRLPSGDWTLNELGELENLPDVLKELQIEIPNIARDLRTIRPGAPGFPSFIQPGDGTLDLSIESDDDAHRTITIKIANDDGSLAIERQGDEPIHVVRVDPDGNETSKVYADEEALRKDDPDAYQQYRQFWGNRWHVYRPAVPQIDDARKDFERQLRTQIRDAQEQTMKSRDEAAKAREHARRAAREQVEEAIKEAAPKQVRVETLMITIDPNDGHIKVVIDRGDGKVTYEFNDEKAFEEQEPDLYRKYLEYRD